MGVIRPATPGFLLTLSATVLLIVVTFSVPYLKTIYIVKGNLDTSGVGGSITLGTLGYCLELSGNRTCSKARVGYQLGAKHLCQVYGYPFLIRPFEDPNIPLENNIPINVPHVVVKWLTYALVLHIAAMGLATISAAVGLVAHIREMSLTWFSSCASEIAAAIAFLAFIFDIVLFLTVRSKIKKVEGGSAEIGIAIWLTLAAWVLLFLSGWIFAIGRHCILGRGQKLKKQRGKGGKRGASDGVRRSTHLEETLPFNATQAEVDRRARQPSSARRASAPISSASERQPLRSDPEFAEEELYSPFAGHFAQTSGYAAGRVPRELSGYTTSSGSSRQPTSSVSDPLGAIASDDFYAAAPAPRLGFAGIGLVGLTAFAAHQPRPSGSGTARRFPRQQPQQDLHNIETPYGNQPPRRVPSGGESGVGSHPQQQVHSNPRGNQSDHQRPPPIETGRGYPPQRQQYEDVHDSPYGGGPAAHAPTGTCQSCFQSYSMHLLMQPSIAHGT